VESSSSLADAAPPEILGHDEACSSSLTTGGGRFVGAQTSIRQMGEMINSRKMLFLG